MLHSVLKRNRSNPNRWGLPATGYAVHSELGFGSQGLHGYQREVIELRGRSLELAHALQ